MTWLVILIPAFPLVGFLLLASGSHRLSKRAVASVAVGSIGLAAIAAAVAAARWQISELPETVFLWRWMSAGGFVADMALRLDGLSVVMSLVVTFVGLLIHVYAVELMASDDGYARFFAYMNLFVAAMLVLVLADDLVLLYLGWEGVGLCSYLLIGFWYRDPGNGRAARKAFIITRIGDAAMALALVIVFLDLGTLRIREVAERAAESWPSGAGIAVAVAALLLAGAVGKSAQLPLQTWLPDAMAGPTPVSALIHAATMVTAGVYLIARMHVLFELAPPVQSIVAVIGAATLLLGASSALAQRDIKRVLAYSTMSQVGYMFLGLGVGAWSAAIFHLFTHACFKALLFLGAGVVIFAQHHEHDISKMGGLRKAIPFTYWSLLIGAAALSGVPLITSGFYSKGAILASAWELETGGAYLWLAGALGAFLTGLYIFRFIFLIFFGDQEIEITYEAGRLIKLSVAALAVLAVIGGLFELPALLGLRSLWDPILSAVLPVPAEKPHGAGALALESVVSLLALAGIALAWWLYVYRREKTMQRPGGAMYRALAAGWHFDVLYDTLFVRPLVWVARLNRADVIDRVFAAIAKATESAHRGLRRTERGLLRWYAAGLLFGAALVLATTVLL